MIRVLNHDKRGLILQVTCISVDEDTQLHGYEEINTTLNPLQP